MNKLQIIHFSQDFATGKAQLGGFSRIYNLCSDSNDHIIFTISNKTNTIDETYLESIKIVTLPVALKSLGKIKQFMLYKKLAVKIQTYLLRNNIIPDILFGHSQIFNFFVLHHLKKTYYSNKKILWEANAIWGIHNSIGLKGKIVNIVNKSLQQKVFKMADQIISQTESSKIFIHNVFKINKSKITVITNAVNIDKYDSFPRNNIIGNHGSKNYNVLCLGLFDELNGIPFLLKLIENNNVDGFEFTFVGAGKYKYLVELAASQGKCNYLGSLPYSVMQSKYADFDFVIIPRLPQIEADLFIPTKLVEAMYHGLVPICSKVKAMQDVVIDGFNGYIFEAGNDKNLLALFRTIINTEREKLNSIASEARDTVVKYYNWDSNYTRLNNIYTDNSYMN